MENEVAVIMPDAAPEYALALLKQYGLAPLNDTAILGIGAGMPPTIGCNGTRFVVKENGESKMLNRLTLDVAVIDAKEPFDKKWYATAYNPDSAEAPDCMSEDGIRPTPGCKLQQSETCATCPQNQFGSGVDAQGNPGKGKDCSDRKRLAVFAAGKAFRLDIMPSALKGWGEYIRQQLNPRGIDVRTCITTIGFAENASYPQYTFKFGGMLPQEQLPAVLSKIGTPEVRQIIDVVNSPQQALTHKPDTGQAEAQAVLAEREAKAAAEKAEAEKAEKKRLADEKKAAAAAAKKGVTTSDDDFGSLGGGMGTQTAQTEATGAAGKPSEADLAKALDLDL